MRILVTGGTGFIGGAIARKLVENGHEVLITGTQSEIVPPNVKLLPLHLTGIDWNALEGVEAVFHEAAINDTTFKDRKQMLQANFYGSITLFNNLLGLGCKKFIYASSTAAYGDSPAPYIESKTKLNPLNVYAESKALFEEFAEEFGRGNRGLNVNVVGLRYCNVYGPGEGHKGKRMSMIGQIARTLIRGERPKLFTGGEQKRDWIYVDDVVSANLAALNFEGTDVFNCGSGAATSFNQITEILNNGLNLNIEPEYIPNPYEGAYQDYTECDMSKAKELLKFKPKFDIVKGINSYIQQGFDR